MIRLALVFLLMSAPPYARAAQPQAVVTASEPREFGYFVGDVFRRDIDIVAPDPYRLDSASQPKPRRLNYWLELRDATVTETRLTGGRRYHLVLDYQTFYVPLSPTRLTVPEVQLRFSAGDDSVEAEVPPFSFTMSPLREVQPEQPEEGPAGYLRPDAVPRIQSARAARTGFSAGLVAFLLGLVLLAYHRAWWPFRARPHRPFTRAESAIRRRLAHGADPDTYRHGLLDLHRAFDQSAGRRLLAEDVPEFLAAHREFQSLREEISRFFASSRRAFFGSDPEGAAETMPFGAVAELGARLSEVERRET
jgi:mxaA protein